MEGTDREFIEGAYGRWNNNFNDLYEGYVYRSMMKAFNASYAVMLGDIFSCQNLPNQEFKLRLSRFLSVFSPAPVRHLCATAT